MPVTRPARDITFVLPRARVNPAREPVISTSASFNPSTIDPTNCRLSSSSISRIDFSCSFSSLEKSSSSGKTEHNSEYCFELISSFFSICLRIKVIPRMRARKTVRESLNLSGFMSWPVFDFQNRKCFISCSPIFFKTLAFFLSMQLAASRM